MSTSTHNQETSTSTKNAKQTKEGNFCKRICDAIDEASEKTEKKARERKGPKPWIERKFMIGVVIALFGWSSYDFLGVILLRCLRRKDNAIVGFAGGVVLTIIYCIFWIMFTLTYAKLIFTGPGFAKDHVPHSEPPLPSDPPPELNTNRPANNGTYPPSIRAPTSEYRPSMEDRITHHSASLNDHGEFESPNPNSPNPRSFRGDEQGTIGVPYTSMQPRAHKKSESGSNIAIPPTPRALDSSSSPSPITPTQPKPALLRKNSKPSAPPSPSEPRASNRLARASSSSRNTVSPPASPGIPTFSNTRKSESSREGKTRPEMLKAASGFRFESTSTMDPSRLQSRTHSRTQSQGNAPTTLPTPSMSAPQTPSTPTPRIGASATHPTINLGGRTEPVDDAATEIHLGSEDDDLETGRTRLDSSGRPQPYLDDLPPIEEKWQRRPSDQPVLDPYYRYCTRDGLVKPMRAHHCRICNTCVLGYDHHCPWVGSCVGARNRKFFVVFLFWSSLYTLYTFALLIYEIYRSNNPRPTPSTRTPPGTLDGNSLALLIATALFALFTTGMLGSHVHLLCRNASTVEWHGIQSTRERERAMVSQAVPVCGCLGMDNRDNAGLLGSKGEPWKEEEGLKGFKGRVALRKRFDEEWGRVGKEGNLWWLGSNRANWEAVMGRNKWAWFLPVGDTSQVGLTYPTNPRFDEHGRWMRRREWPLELR